MKRRAAIWGALVAIALIACDRDRGPKGSGALDASDKALFQYLPGGEPVYWGGNYLKLQNVMQSAMGQLSTVFAQQLGSGMTTWMACFTDLKQLKLAASIDVAGRDVQMRTVLAGISLDDVAKCGQQAGFATTIDPDHKFVSIALPAPAATTGYLVLPSGALYSRQSFAIATVPTVSGVVRADLEGDIAKLGGKTAADDPTLGSLVPNVDRTKTVWFTGTAANTPLGDKIGEGWGTFDVSSGLALDITIQVKNPADADKVEQGIAQLRTMADQAPGDLKDVIKNLKLSRSGDHLRFTLAISEAVLKSLISQFGGMLGAGMH